MGTEFAAPHSIHSLVRLLKSSTDPPSASGPSKIEIASLAWSDPSFRAANKGEVIAEWVLIQLGEAKKTRREDAKFTSDPIVDLRYWTLLCGVLTTPSPTAARPIKTWLLPLLNRFQLDTIVLRLLTLLPSRVLGPARTALTILWPLAEKKISVDALGECLEAVFETCTDWERVDDDLAWICSAVVGAYRNALGNAGNKKKLYTSFLATHLSSWLCAIRDTPALASPSPMKQLKNSIFAAGTDTLFSLDALKQPLDILFNALSSTFTPSLLPVLPNIFSSFLSAMHRHRSSLSISATTVVSAREETKAIAMEFVRKCWARVWAGTSLQEGVDLEKWKSIIGVFEIVEKERLFVVSRIRGMQNDMTNGEHGGEKTLDEVRDKAIEILESVNAVFENGLAENLILPAQLLDVLVRIEYSFIGAVLERVLSALINIPQSFLCFVTFSNFLIHILEYHIKTRTVHTYVSALLGAVVAKRTSPTSSPPSVTYAFPLAYHLPAVAHALRTSLTHTQVTPLVTGVIQAVENTWMTVKDAYQEDERPAKAQKVGTGANGSEREAISGSVRAFSYTCRIAGTALSNLPASAYSEDGEYSLESLCGDVGNLGWTIIWETLITRTGKGHDKVGEGGSRKRKRAAQNNFLCVSYPQGVTSASLRFLYDIRARVSRPLGDCDQLGEAHVQTLLNVVRDEASEPELILEIIRTLLWHVWDTHNRGSSKQMDPEPVFTATLDLLTARLSPKSKWSGVSAALTRDNLSLALLHVLTERWIDVLDAQASPKSLERFVSLLLTISLDPPDESIQESPNEAHLRAQVSVTLRGILLNLLRNAQFWELHNIRAVFLCCVLTLTTPFSSFGFAAAAVESPPTVGAADQVQLALACDVYRFLDYVPPEYFTRPVRAELVKRAIAGDVQICAMMKCADRDKGKTVGRDLYRGYTGPAQKSHVGEPNDVISEEESKDWSGRLTFIRVFLQRMGPFLNTLGHHTSFTFGTHLLSPPPCITVPPKALAIVTLDLFQSHFLSLLRLQEPEAVASASSIITTLIIAQPFSRPRSQETWTHILAQSSILKLVERLTTDFTFPSLSDEVQRSLKTLFESLESALLPDMARLVEGNSTELNQFLSSERVNAWSRFLSLKRWIGIDPKATFIPFGLKLAVSVIRCENSGGLDAETCASVLGLLFGELACVPDVSHDTHLDALVAVYATCGSDRSPTQNFQQLMDDRVVQASKKLSIGDFARLLDVLAEEFEGGQFQMGYRERLIHLSKIMLHNAPPGTLNVVQSSVTGWLGLFAEQEQIYEGSSNMKMECLEFIARHCLDRPASIRSVDLGSIWTFLHKILTGSPEHDQTTASPIFHHVVTIISALVRLRRDLVIHTLPHLGLVLRQLMMLMRKVRPQLGAKQSKLVTDTLPSWLSASQPLFTDEARAFARLLTSLTAKTVPKAHATVTGESQKAESLAKPFAKHASYVLLAYIDAFNDPLCIINAEMRRELEPGLFALCEMVGEHSRDALMVSALDSGGKAIFKSLWRDYEKQRYVGRG